MAEPTRPGTGRPGTGRPGTGRPRIVGLDALRGSALCGMVVYHLAWDLHALGWPGPDPSRSPGWTAFGDLVAGTFLALSGAGLALARPKGLGVALRRLAVLAAAGLAVTAASLWFAPEAPVFFGILHCILVSDALALATLRLSAPVRLVLAGLAAEVPMLMRGARFDGAVGAVLGLAGTPPTSLDYRPLLPWLALVLLGTVVGDALGRRRGEGAPSRWATPVLRWMGRHSLALYLLHQPLLYGGLVVIGLALGGPLDPDPLDRQCRSDCVATGAGPRLCAAACACTAERLAAEARSGATTLTSRRLADVGAACREAGG